jgi:hypothetical protein
MVLLSATSQTTTLPLLAVMKYGRGRVVGFSAFDLWRWDFVPKGFGLEASPFSRILVNAVGWLTEREEVKRLLVSTPKAVYLRGEPVDVFARAVDENLKPLGNAVLQGEVLSKPGGEALRAFSMTDRGGGSHVARIDFLPPSRYRARVTALLDGEDYATETVDFTVEERSLEDFDFDGDRGLLARLAAATGGISYSPDRALELVDDLNLGMVVVRSHDELRFRLNLTTFLVLVAILGLEWLLRKRRMLL